MAHEVVVFFKADLAKWIQSVFILGEKIAPPFQRKQYVVTGASFADAENGQEISAKHTRVFLKVFPHSVKPVFCFTPRLYFRCILFLAHGTLTGTPSPDRSPPPPPRPRHSRLCGVAATRTGNRASSATGRAGPTRRRG